MCPTSPAQTNVSPALDYSTDHTYKLSPDRLLWIFDGLGYAGPMNEYLGVFWWNQRKREGARSRPVTVHFNGAFVAGDQVFVNIGGQACGKSVFPNESTAIIARHFEYFINANYVGVWAKRHGRLTHHHCAIAEAGVFLYVRRAGGPGGGIDWLSFDHRRSHRRPTRTLGR